MLPTLWPGDVLTVHALRSEDAETGEIVLYMRQDRFFIHRVVGQSCTPGAFLITRGDCMPRNDPPVRRSELMGRVTQVWRSGSVFLPRRKLSLPGRYLAWLFCHWSLFRRIGLRLRSRGQQSDSPLQGQWVTAA